MPAGGRRHGAERARTAGYRPAGGSPLETGAHRRDRCRGWPMLATSSPSAPR